MDTRRDFIKKSTLLAGSVGIHSLPKSIKKAVAINPDPGTTFEDAEHVVLLMQENRSFDHVFGTLQGVRGYNDPRAITLPNKNKVWLQTNKKGETYMPFRLDLKGTKATWMGSLPHDWESMVDARNKGRYDQWLEAKRPEREKYKDMPLSLGYYNREDLPFYYALADAFTVCDHHFCSSLTATTPNRLYFFTGTVREEPRGDSPANLHTSNVDYNSLANWVTFPERLEKENISWKVYQNELSLSVGLKGEESSWLANFTNNDLEWFTQYHVRFHPAHFRYMKKKAEELKTEIQALEKGTKERTKKERLLKKIAKDLKKYTPEQFKALSKVEQNLHHKAFTTNVNDPDYHELKTLQYKDAGKEKEIKVPKGDALYQFRKDVENGQLPIVSWLIPSARFSDHPGSPWYGTWYVSEVFDILTQNPEIWKKTIFIMTYDENDGYFDHLPPFTAPDPGKPESGKCSSGIDTTPDYVTESQAKALKGKFKDPKRVSPIGLGYRIPFVVASPWSKGGWVNSQVSDNTSVLMFLEKFLTKKTGKQIREDNISEWRRVICGDLTSIFRPYNGEDIRLPKPVEKKSFVESIYDAQFKNLPFGYKKLTEEEIGGVNNNSLNTPLMPQQEKGIRSSSALPYQLYASGTVQSDKRVFELKMKAENNIFEDSKVGAPFTVYNLSKFAVRNYAIRKGDELIDHWDINNNYHFNLHGPNGFFRSFKGSISDPKLLIQPEYERKRMNQKKGTGNIELKLSIPEGQEDQVIELTDNAYKKPGMKKKINTGTRKIVILNLKDSFGWYDFTLRIKGNNNFERRYAGHVETGDFSFTDPLIGGVIL